MISGSEITMIFSDERSKKIIDNNFKSFQLNVPQQTINRNRMQNSITYLLTKKILRHFIQLQEYQKLK